MEKIKIQLKANIPIEWLNKMFIFIEKPAVKRQERYWSIHWNSNFILIEITAHEIAGWILLFVFFAKNIQNTFSAYMQPFPSLRLVMQNEADWQIPAQVFQKSPVSNNSKLIFITFCHQNSLTWMFIMVLN